MLITLAMISKVYYTPLYILSIFALGTVLSLIHSYWKRGKARDMLFRGSNDRIAQRQKVVAIGISSPLPHDPSLTIPFLTFLHHLLSFTTFFFLSLSLHFTLIASLFSSFTHISSKRFAKTKLRPGYLHKDFHSYHLQQRLHNSSWCLGSTYSRNSSEPPVFSAANHYIAEYHLLQNIIQISFRGLVCVICGLR